MKLYISSDIEGTAGITHWDETDKYHGGSQYDAFAVRMSQEVAAACEGAFAGGAGEILVKDAHGSGRNILTELLPRGVKIRRGWSGSIYSMVEGIDGGFDALAFTGYHSPGYGDGNPLAHTITSSNVSQILINGIRASEFLMFSYAAAMHGVPVIFLSGDQKLCEIAGETVPGIVTVASSEGIGNGSIGLHPLDCQDLIREGMREAVSRVHGPNLKLPEHFEVSVEFHNHFRAYDHAQYPGAVLLDEKKIGFSNDSYLEVLRFFHFCL